MANQMQATSKQQQAPHTYRITAAIVGLFYLAAMVAYGVGNGLVQSILAAPDPLLTLFANSTPMVAGALLMLINSAIVAGHGIMMLPLLKRHNERIAVGYLGSRLVEAIVLTVGVIFLLLQIPLGREYLAAGASNLPYLEALSTLSMQANFYAYEIGMIAVGFAGLVLCYSFYRTGLVPRLLAVWGLIGYISFLGGSVLQVMGFDLQLLHTIPGGLWELFIGVWLIVKGFNVFPALSKHPASATTPTMITAKVDGATA